MSGSSLRRALAVVALTAGLLPNSAVADGGTRETPLVRAVQQSRKSVVNIHTEKTAPDDKDSRFFSPNKSRKVTGMGTGIVVDERGYIVTNYHVIQDVDLITVTLDGGATYDARTVSYDRRHDLAVIRVTASEPLTVMPMGTSSDLMLAETVYAVGNAFGYEHTVTAGIISALHRDVEVDETQSYENLIQTDASINPGNSGGPLLNLNGEVIGINVAIRSGAQRIGFAIPIDDARRTIARLLSVERLNGLPHGLQTVDVKSAVEKKLVVDDVSGGSAGDLCGIRKGDVIRTIRGITVSDATDLERALLDLPRGKVVDVTLLRDGKEHTMQFTVGVGRQTATIAQNAAQQDVVVPGREQKTAAVNVSLQNPTTPAESNVEPAVQRAWEILGLKLEPLTDVEKQEITGRTYPGARGPVQYHGGLRVVSVRPGSVASRILKEGDILLGLDGYETLGAPNLTYILGENRIRQMTAMKCQYYRRGSNPLEGTLQLTP